MGYEPKRPEPPCTRLIKEGTISRCTSCGSSIVRRWCFFGKIVGCIQPKCKNYHKRYQSKRPSLEDEMKTVIALPLRIGTVYDLLEVEGIYDLETYDIVEADYDFIHEAMKNFKISQYMINKLKNPVACDCGSTLTGHDR